MALSDWLTRDEWNAAFLGYMALVTGDEEGFPWPVDLSTQLRVGIIVVNKAGYTDWAGISIGDPDDYKTVSGDLESRLGVDACTAERDNSACLAELMTGKLDILARAAETLVWLEAHPEIAFEPLTMLCQHLLEETA